MDLFRNLKSLSQNFSDIRVVVQGKTYSCHKIILGSASEFFQCLLLSDCKETSSGVINLEDIETSTFDIIYEFIYSAGDKTALKHAPIPLLLELLVFADKWFMPGLTASCTNVLEDCDDWKIDELVNGFDTALTLQNFHLKGKVENLLRRNRNDLDDASVNKMNSTNLKEYLKFCRTHMHESDRFYILERWIKNQAFYSPGMEFSCSDASNVEVAELLSLIDYENMDYKQFLSGPGKSNLLSYKEKYTKLCEICDNLIEE